MRRKALVGILFTDKERTSSPASDIIRDSTEKNVIGILTAILFCNLIRLTETQSLAA
jgi:hypothetical protein